MDLLKDDSQVIDSETSISHAQIKALTVKVMIIIHWLLLRVSSYCMQVNFVGLSQAI